MPELKLLPHLSAVSDDYDAILCDVWGVLHDGRAAFASACDAIRRFRAPGKAVVLVTNAPVPGARVTGLFPKLGVPMDCFDDVVTSGEATRHELAMRAPGPVYAIGLGEDKSVYAGLGVEFTSDPAKAKVICCTSLREYPNGDPETYRGELRALAGHKLPFVCANPDVQFRHGDKLIWSAGALAAIYAEMGGEVIYPGKPDPAIYRLACERVGAIVGRSVQASRILAIGDGPSTDIRGANLHSFDGLFIGGGIHGHAMAEGDGFLAGAAAVLAEAGVSARYAAPVLAW